MGLEISWEQMIKKKKKGQVQVQFTWAAIELGAEPAGLMSSLRGSLPEFISYHLENACPSTGICDDSGRRRDY